MLKGKAINGTISDLVAPKIANVKKTYSHDDTIKYIDISSINAEVHSVSQVTEYSVKNAPSRAQQCVKYGDLLVSTVRPINRNIAIVDKDLDNLVASTGFCVLRPNDGMLNYLLSIVLSHDFTNAMCDKANGGVYPAVNNGDVLNYQIHIPDDDLAKRASLVRQQADKSKFMRSKSQFIEMFGDQNINSRQWPEGLVKDEFKLSMGKTPARNNPACWEDGTNKWISISDMASYTRYTGDTNECITDFAIEDSGIKAVPKGTIIMSFKLSIGRTAITSEDIYTNEAIMAFADFDKKKFNIDFLHFLIANKNWLLGAKQAVKGQTLNKESIGNAKIIIPPLAIQEEFARIYNQADKSKFMRSKSQFIEMFGSMDTTPVGEYVLDSFPGEWGIEDTNGTGVKVIRTTNFTNSGKLNLTDVITREIEMKKVNKKRIMKYDTILERSGGTTDNPVGRVVLFEEDGLYLCNNFTQVLRFKDIDPRFAFYSLFYFYQTNKTAIRGMGNKTTGIQNLNMSKYLGIGIPNALVEQQKAFTAIAEQADKSKFELKKAIEAIDKVIKSLINENL